MSFTPPFLLGPVFFNTALPCSGGYHLERGWDAVTWCGWGKLWKGRNYWNSIRRCQVYGLRDVCWMIVWVFSDMPWLLLFGIWRNTWYIVIITMTYNIFLGLFVHIKHFFFSFISPDLTWLPLLGVGRKSWYIIIIISFNYLKSVNFNELIPVANVSVYF